MRIHLLHTAESNIAVFKAAAVELNIPAQYLRHHVREDLLQACEMAGGLTQSIRQQTVETLLQLAEDAEVVLLTCSTLGPAAEDAAKQTSVRMLRVDRALAETALAAEGHITVLYAVETTKGPTLKLFADVQGEREADISFSWVAEAWERFKQGNSAGYLQLIAAAADKAYQNGAEVVVLAQASMAGAANLTQFGIPLTSPLCGLRAAMSPETA
ncbi:aspartate/glutamate racemase family protein [Serratia sp. M24T3]|uniref:aspartate/glutamate racemase family protein n=1 Tax=Serratia sp. M24T3 TaxID=932213 RepID=UPI00025BA306|nr:aspartate/glutamate racemase family protein [Serratia sp. M24T3]EIC83753.1 hypothetical protein SPM24T3_15131 [Serratia sp. M24T3]